MAKLKAFPGAPWFKMYSDHEQVEHAVRLLLLKVSLEMLARQEGKTPLSLSSKYCIHIQFDNNRLSDVY